MSELFGYLAIFLMGMTLGMIGAGGSILTVPILVYLFKVDPTIATAYSLALVGGTAAIGAGRHFARGGIDARALLAFGLPSVIGVYLARRHGLPRVPDVVGTIGAFEVTRDLLIMLSFAVLMVVAAILMIRGRRGDEERGVARKFTAARLALAAGEGLLVGAFTGMVGAGGGFLIVPALIWMLGLSMRTAVATSLMIIALKSLIGFAGDLQGSQQVDWVFLGALFALSALGILGGVALGRRLASHQLQWAFGWFVLCTGIFTIVRELSR